LHELKSVVALGLTTISRQHPKIPRKKKDRDVQLAILVLCRTRFGQKMWEAWKGNSDKVGFLVHTSGNDSDVEAKYRLPTQVPTCWGGIGVVYAEVRLYREALVIFPKATHFAFLSESCLPIWPN
jgi:hypothetical protein